MEWIGRMQLRGPSPRIAVEELIEGELRNLRQWGVRLRNPRYLYLIKMWLVPVGPGDEEALVYKSLRDRIYQGKL